MANSTGPILVVGAISEANHWILNGQGFDFKILLGTGVAALGLAGIEKIPGLQPIATGIAYIALVTLLFARLDGKPSPAENLLRVSGLGK